MAAVFQLDVLAASVPFFQGKCVSAVIPVTDGEDRKSTRLNSSHVT